MILNVSTSNYKNYKPQRHKIRNTKTQIEYSSAYNENTFKCTEHKPRLNNTFIDQYEWKLNEMVDKASILGAMNHN